LQVSNIKDQLQKFINNDIEFLTII